MSNPQRSHSSNEEASPHQSLVIIETPYQIEPKEENETTPINIELPRTFNLKKTHDFSIR
jgi:hypothetical protein